MSERPTGVVLAGGRSRRFGDDKLRATVGGLPLLRRAVERLAPLCAEVIVVANAGRRIGPRVRERARVVRDDLPGAGPLAGLATGLRHARTEVVFAVGGDMPLVNLEAVKLVVGALGDHDAAVPLLRGRPQVLHAAYAVRVGGAASEALRRGESSIVGLLRGLDVAWLPERLIRSVDPRALTFVSVNTRHDLARARRRAREA